MADEVDSDDAGCIITCAGCGGALTRDEANELGAILAANDTFRADLMNHTVPQAVQNRLHAAVTFHAIYTCPRCGPYQRIRVSYLDGPPVAAA